jgi:MFS family permease
VGKVAFWKSVTSIMINTAGFLGMSLYGVFTQRLGRRLSFAIAFVAALISTAAVFAYLNDVWHIFVLVPIMGFCQLAIFAGYAIYFPELFPTHLRSTGISFCYNVGRFVAALGPLVLGLLTESVFSQTDEPLRNAGLAMCGIFIVGLFFLPFAPETKGQPLPD